MKTKLLLTPLLLCCSIVSFAQVQKEEVPNPYKHDIGFNTTFILQGLFHSNSTPFALLYKKYTGDHKAIRYGVNVRYNSNNNDLEETVNPNYSLSSTTKGTSASISVSIGKEFQKEINNKWLWYYGADIAPNYTMSNNENSMDVYDFQSFQDTNLTASSKHYSVGLGLQPFLGIRFNINPRLYLSAEASLQLGYSYYKRSTKNLNPNPPGFDPSNPEISSTVKGNSASVFMSPASGLFLFYRF